MAGYELRTMPVEKLRPADYNPRVSLRPGDPDYEKLKGSISDLGIIAPLIWNETTGNLVGGHQRLQILIDRGDREVPVYVVQLSPEKEKQANLALNKITGRWDAEKLNVMLQELDPSVVKLAGFDPKDIKPITPVEALDIDQESTQVRKIVVCHCPKCGFDYEQEVVE